MPGFSVNSMRLGSSVDLDSLDEVGRYPAELAVLERINGQRRQAGILKIDLHAADHPAGIQYLQIAFGTNPENAALLCAGEARQRRDRCTGKRAANQMTAGKVDAGHGRSLPFNCWQRLAAAHFISSNHPTVIA